MPWGHSLNTWKQIPLYTRGYGAWFKLQTQVLTTFNFCLTVLLLCRLHQPGWVLQTPPGENFWWSCFYRANYFRSPNQQCQSTDMTCKLPYPCLQLPFVKHYRYIDVNSIFFLILPLLYKTETSDCLTAALLFSYGYKHLDQSSGKCWYSVAHLRYVTWTSGLLDPKSNTEDQGAWILWSKIQSLSTDCARSIRTQ